MEQVWWLVDIGWCNEAKMNGGLGIVNYPLGVYKENLIGIIKKEGHVLF